jgi:hypothetical protein
MNTLVVPASKSSITEFGAGSEPTARFHFAYLLTSAAFRRRYRKNS